YLVVWEDYRNGSYNVDIYGSRVTPEGVVIEPDGIPISTAIRRQTSPKVAFDGRNYLVVWEDYRNGYLNSDIYGCRVTQGGFVLDSIGIPVFTTTNPKKSPVVEFDGTNFLVVWEEQKNGEVDLYGAWVTPDGIVLDTFPVAIQERDQAYPALAKGPGNQMFLVYQGWAGKVGGKNYNTCRIWGKMNPAPGIEERFPTTANGSRQTATIVRKVLRWNKTEDRRPKTEDRAQAFLVDVTGRKVFELMPGENDIRHLSPGVYFIRNVSGIERKVVITK
ncbi:MAG: hypothetical protein ABIK18_04190, partial [candidate division WOR-3 bacterium]